MPQQGFTTSTLVSRHAIIGRSLVCSQQITES